MNADLISRSALMRDMGVTDAVKWGNETAEQQHNSYDTLMKYEIADYIRDAPTIDAVEVVRCRECIHRGSAYCPMCHEDYHFDEDDGADYVTRDYTEDDGYCNQGERMEGGDSDD